MKHLSFSTILLLVFFMGCQQHRPLGFSLFNRNEIVEEYHAPTHQVSVMPEYRGARPSRVVLIESNQSSGNYNANQKLIAELANQFRESGMFEVVTPTMRLAGHQDNIQQGKFSERDLARISREFNAGAVGVIRINELKTHPPLRTSISIAFIDSNESVTACGIDGVWDLANANTRADFQNFVACNGRSGVNNLSLQSPNLLFKFVASQIAGSIASSGY